MSERMNIGGIFYFYSAKAPDPRAQMWQQGLSNPAVEFFVANPASGPGSSPDSNWKAIVEAGRRAGKVCLGYIATDYSRVPEVEIENQIKLYADFYGIRSVFYDEASAGPLALKYYKDLYDAVKGRVVINPGVIPSEGYVQVADTICLFESTFAKWQTMVWPDWIREYPRSKWFAIVMGCNQSQAESVCKTTAHLGYVYPIERIDSDDVDGFEVLPPYFSMIPRWLKIPEVTEAQPVAPIAENTALRLLIETANIMGIGVDQTMKDTPHRAREVMAELAAQKEAPSLRNSTNEQVLAEALRRMK